MEKQVKVTFDKNVYEFVVDPDKPADLSLQARAVFKSIHQLIIDGRVLPFISESILTYEVLARKSRQGILSNDKPLVVCHEGNKMTISSNPALHPGNHPKDDLYLSKAISLGFKILPGKRFGKLINPDVKKEWYYYSEKEYLEISDRFSGVATEIENLGAGYRYYQEVSGLLDNPHRIIYEVLKQYRGKEKKLSATISEWSDGDSVALHMAYGLDYFCTFDHGINAGKRSVFNDDICKKLDQKFGFKKVTPFELIERLKTT